MSMNTPDPQGAPPSIVDPPPYNTGYGTQPPGAAGAPPTQPGGAFGAYGTLGAVTRPPVPPAAARLDPVGRFGRLYPRWPLLAAMVLTPLVVAAYGVHFYFSSHTCGFGALCQIDRLPPIILVPAIWLGFALLWQVALAFGIAHGLEGDQTARTRFDDTLKMLTDFNSVRWLVVVYGALVVVALLWAALHHLLDTITFALGVVFVVVAICHLIYRPPRPRLPAGAGPGAQAQAQYRQNRADSVRFGTVWRTLPPWRFVLLPRAAPPPPGTANPAQPTNQ